jgi:hypothetical protein
MAGECQRNQDWKVRRPQWLVPISRLLVYGGGRVLDAMKMMLPMPVCTSTISFVEMMFTSNLQACLAISDKCPRKVVLFTLGLIFIGCT